MRDKCPFCKEPAVKIGLWAGTEFRCGTQGPDANGEYKVSHNCDIKTWTRLLREKDETIARLRAGIAAVDNLIGNSRGVVGLHLNGDEALWSELLAGGRYEEWLRDFSEATA